MKEVFQTVIAILIAQAVIFFVSQFTGKTVAKAAALSGGEEDEEQLEVSRNKKREKIFNSILRKYHGNPYNEYSNYFKHGSKH